MNRTLDGDVQFHDGEIGISQCVWCRHRAADGRRCRAFPDGIPAAIAGNRHDHREPYDGDRGVLFEPEVVEIEFVDVDVEEAAAPVAVSPSESVRPSFADEPTAPHVISLDDPEAGDDIVFDLEDVVSA